MKSIPFGLMAFSIHFSGFYSNISKRPIVLFRENTTLYLVIDSQTFPFDPLTISSYTIKKTVGDHHQIFWIRHLTIRLHDRVIMDTDYDDICPTFEPDFTPFIEPEDFDFGLFLENLSKDKNRQSQLFQDENMNI